MVVANAPLTSNGRHVHAEAIKAWADGCTIECLDFNTKTWIEVSNPKWLMSLIYRIKPTKPKDKAMEALIVLSPHAGPLLYAAAPDEANCSLVFDGESNKLVHVVVIKPSLEAFKQPSEASNNHSQWLCSLNQFKRTGEL